MLTGEGNVLYQVLPPVLLHSLTLPTTSLEPMDPAAQSFSAYWQTNVSWSTTRELGLQTTHWQRASSGQEIPITRRHLPQIQPSPLFALSTPMLPLIVTRQALGSSLLSFRVIRENVEAPEGDGLEQSVDKLEKWNRMTKKTNEWALEKWDDDEKKHNIRLTLIATSTERSWDIGHSSATQHIAPTALSDSAPLQATSSLLNSSQVHVSSYFHVVQLRFPSSLPSLSNSSPLHYSIRSATSILDELGPPNPPGLSGGDLVQVTLDSPQPVPTTLKSTLPLDLLIPTLSVTSPPRLHAVDPRALTAPKS